MSETLQPLQEQVDSSVENTRNVVAGDQTIEVPGLEPPVMSIEDDKTITQMLAGYHEDLKKPEWVVNEEEHNK